MKVKALYLLTLFSLLLSVPAAAGPVRTFEKKLSETFPISDNGTVRLDNRYGEIQVNTWNQSRVQIDVLIRVEADSESDFQDMLKRIDVSLSGSNNRVSGVTTIESRRSASSWWGFITGDSHSDDFKIYYTVNLPATVQLEVDARYCDVALPNLSGTTRLDVGYGDLVAGRLSGKSEVDVSYGSARIEQLGNNSAVKLRYSEGSLRSAGDLTYDGRYSEMSFGTVGVLRLDVGYEEVEVETAESVYLQGNYNDLTVGTVGSVNLSGNYTDFEFGTVTNSLVMEGNYGDIDVDRLAAGFSEVRIRLNYGDVKIDVDNPAGYELNLKTRYGDIDVPTTDLSPRNISSEGSSKSVTGKKAGTGSGRINIEINYGDIEIY